MSFKQGLVSKLLTNYISNIIKANNLKFYTMLWILYNSMAIIIFKLSLAKKLPTTPTPSDTHTHTCTRPHPQAHTHPTLTYQREKSHFTWLAPWEWMEEGRKGTSGNIDKNLHFLNIIFQLWLKARDNITALYRWQIFHKHKS